MPIRKYMKITTNMGSNSRLSKTLDLRKGELGYRHKTWLWFINMLKVFDFT